MMSSSTYGVLKVGKGRELGVGGCLVLASFRIVLRMADVEFSVFCEREAEPSSACFILLGDEPGSLILTCIEAQLWIGSHCCVSTQVLRVLLM